MTIDEILAGMGNINTVQFRPAPKGGWIMSMVFMRHNTLTRVEGYGADFTAAAQDARRRWDARFQHFEDRTRFRSAAAERAARAAATSVHAAAPVTKIRPDGDQ